ncbi:MAG: Sec-independent protein translocase protein TatB [Holosporales bacterium]
MIDAFWTEIFVISLIALIFLGPSDLLILLRSLGRFWGKVQETIYSLKLAIDFEEHKKKLKDDEDAENHPKDPPQ